MGDPQNMCEFELHGLVQPLGSPISLRDRTQETEGMTNILQSAQLWQCGVLSHV